MAQRKSLLQTRHENLHEKVCIPNINDRKYNIPYSELVSKITNQGTKKDLIEIVEMTELFVSSLKENKKNRYCNPKHCRTLPYIHKVRDTRDFIPTSYHILQDYDLLYIKSEASSEALKDITRIRDPNIWEQYAERLIKKKGEKLKESIKSKYYQDCVETIQRVIFLRNFDLQYCIESSKTSERENHEKFIGNLTSLKDTLEEKTGLIKKEQNISESVEVSGVPPNEGSKPTFVEMLKKNNEKNTPL